MSGTVAWLCPYCKGRVSSTRTFDMATSIKHHVNVCPSAPLPAAPAGDLPISKRRRDA